MLKKSSASINAPFLDLQLNDTLGRCLTRICAWRSPPNWSGADWFQEIKAHAMYAACQAQQDYDPTRGGVLCGFVYQRVMARAYTRYRQELTYARRYASAAENGESDETRNFDGDSAATEVARFCDELQAALASLSDAHRSIIEQIFWHERTEIELALAIGISQQAVNKRKHLALLLLSEMLRGEKMCGRRL